MLGDSIPGLLIDQPLALTATQWVLTLLVVLLGGVAIGVGGFGIALVTTPVLVWLMPIPTVAVTNLSLSVMLRLPVVYLDRHYLVRPLAKNLILGGGAGLPIGVLLLRVLDRDDIKLFASAAVFVLGLPYLLRPERIPMCVRRGPASTRGVGLMTGILTSSTSLAGPPVVLWLLNQRLVDREYRGTVSLVTLALNSAGVALLIGSGTAAVGSLILPLFLLPIAALGGYLGNRLGTYLPARFFTRILAILIITSGAIGVWNTL